MRLRRQSTSMPRNDLGLPGACRAEAMTVLTAAVLCAGGCPVTFERTLPRDLDAAVRFVLDHRDAFAQPVSPPTGVGVPGDPLDGVVGCWGSHEAYAPDDEVPVRTYTYSVYRFGPDGSLTMWDVADVGGYYAIVLRSEGRYEILDNTTVSAEVERVWAYDAGSGGYTLFGEPASGLRWLVTLTGDELRLRIIVDDDDTPGPADVVFRRMDCEP